MQPIRPVQTDQFAAVDLGSNSFHLLVARLHGDQIKVVDRLREQVRLAAGLTPEKQLSVEAEQRALACLERFGQRLRGLPPGSVRAVGTNTLRKARNAREFLVQAQRVLGHEIQVVSGFEEARLIYLGVAHSLADDGGRRLVMDIGGGSTEFIIGEGFEARLMESLHVGCVGLTERYFADGQISRKRLEAAENAARVELEPIEAAFRRAGWERAVGSSGSVRAVERVVTAAGWAPFGITAASLPRLRKALLAAGHVDRLDLKGLSSNRKGIFAGGFAIVAAAFQALGIERMEAADGALREGLLYDLLGRIRHEDVRGRSVAALARRYHVDTEQADRVEGKAVHLLRQVADDWGLADEGQERMLRWAARLHETGLDISHSQYHKHGGYVVSHSDLAGFARQEQLLLATLVRAHRRKYPSAVFEELPAEWVEEARRLAVLLRLAVVLHRGRGTVPLPEHLTLRAKNGALRLQFPEGWLEDYPLVRLDLTEERDRLAAAGFRLDWD